MLHIHRFASSKCLYLEALAAMLGVVDAMLEGLVWEWQTGRQRDGEMKDKLANLNLS